MAKKTTKKKSKEPINLPSGGGNYSVFYPEDAFKPGADYFYFQHLLTNKKHASGEHAAQELGQAADRNLMFRYEDIYGEEKRDIDKQKEMIEQSLAFLRELRDLSLESEKKWVQNKIASNKSLSAEFKKEILQFYEKPDILQIDKVLYYINTLFSSLQGYKNFLNFEYKRQQTYVWAERKVKEILDGEGKEKFLHREYQQIYDNTDGGRNNKIYRTTIAYLQAKLKDEKTKEENKKAIERYLRGTLVDQVAQILQKVYNDIIDDEKKLTSFFETYASKDTRFILSSIPVLRQQFFTIILPIMAQDSIRGLNFTFSKALEYLMDESFYSSNTSEINSIVESIEDRILNPDRYIEIEAERQGKTLGTVMANLRQAKKRYQEILQYCTEDEEQTMKAFKRLTIGTKEVVATSHERTVKGIKQSYTTMKNITARQIQILEKTIKEEGHELYKPSKKRKIKMTSRERIMKTVTNIIIEERRKELPTFSEKDVTPQMLAEKMNIYLKDKFTVNYSSSRSFFAEMGNFITRDNLTKGVRSNLTSAFNKEDMKSFRWGEVEIPLGIDPKAFHALATDIVDYLLRLPHTKKTDLELPEIKQIITEEREEEQKETEKEEKKKRKSGTEYDLQKETEDYHQRYTQVLKDLQKGYTDEEGNVQNLDFFIEGIKNGIVEDDSTKNYKSHAMGDVFEGGSFGGTLKKQIDNILFMAEAGGIELDEEWLRFSILNSSSSNRLIGNENTQTALENLLSIFFAGLLFSDVAFQYKWYTGQYKDLEKELSPAFFRYVRVQGIVVPLSYLLGQLYKNLTELKDNIFNNFFQTYTRDGAARVNIENNIGWGDVVGTRIPGKGTFATSPQDWIDTRDKNINKVKLKLTFLSGFSGILSKAHKYFEVQ